MTAPLLRVRDYTKRFDIHHLGRAIIAFEELAFDLAPGAFIRIAGPNGAGKSTLLRCLYRSYLPTRGHAWYESERGEIDLAHAADVDMALLRRDELGHVSQFLRPRPRVTAVELVAEPLRHGGASVEDARAQAEDLLDRFGLKPALWQAYPTTFSGGEQQKVNLARALIRPRRLLLLDEPTASLDRHTRETMAARLAELKRAGVAMLGVLHHPEDVGGLVDDEIELAPMRSADEEPAHVAE